MLRPLLLLGSVALLAAGCGAAAGHSAPTRVGRHVPTTTGSQVPTGGAQRTSTATTTVSSTKPKRRRAAKHLSCPSLKLGQLPQTGQLPSSTTPIFKCEMAGLWKGIRTGTLAPAMKAFFPEQAYVQLKGIGDPVGDWDNRLVRDYGLDIQAAHALLGAGARHAKLVDVIVPSTFAHTIPPGVCYNRYSYWETPNSRIVYRESGVVRSFGIASMISWRGTWFVVHLGAILRSGYGGEVDAPSTGTGVAAPSSTC